LIRRLIVIPCSVAVIIGVHVNLLFSGLITFIFIIIFIGGLIVLLVSVTSRIIQEQVISFRFIIIIRLSLRFSILVTLEFD